jgi:hypothetical protein
MNSDWTLQNDTNRQMHEVQHCQVCQLGWPAYSTLDVHSRQYLKSLQSSFYLISLFPFLRGTLLLFGSKWTIIFYHLYTFFVKPVSMILFQRNWFCNSACINDSCHSLRLWHVRPIYENKVCPKCGCGLNTLSVPANLVNKVCNLQVTTRDSLYSATRFLLPFVLSCIYTGIHPPFSFVNTIVVPI